MPTSDENQRTIRELQARLAQAQAERERLALSYQTPPLNRIEVAPGVTKESLEPWVWDQVEAQRQVDLWANVVRILGEALSLNDDEAANDVKGWKESDQRAWLAHQLYWLSGAAEGQGIAAGRRLSTYKPEE